ncbi:hypothetical protein GCM10010531_36740 [Blastococcus jejuensis]|uniref:Uncharacterized protein n=1 Tax=Blastococcus jejuensis TaxID=351224 RepID=A0ABP6PNI9_9ACTN
MADDHQHGVSEPSDGEGPRHRHLPPPGFNRRQLLQGGAAVALGAAMAGPPGRIATAGINLASFSGIDPFVAGMHVHANYSEREASWEQQYAAAVGAGANVLWQTDHDFRARALNYVTLLRGTFIGATTGSFAQRAATFSASGPIRVLIEAAGTSRATQSLSMDTESTAVNFFRTGIDGQSIVHAFGASRLDPDALYEVVVQLSMHPAQSGRPAGIYSLRYRFRRNVTVARFKEGGGLIGVVRAPMPANGTTVTLTPLDDIRALWPDMLAIDHSSMGLSFQVTSPRRGVVADVNLRSVTIQRVRHDAAGILAAQRAMAQAWSAKYGITGLVSEEVSLGPGAIAHCNVFGAPPEFNLKADLTTSNWQPWYRDYITRQHTRGGLVSWNHAFGFQVGPVLSAAAQVTKRRQIFAQLSANNLLGADILEVGYNLRGFMPMDQHCQLWDTFSRRARWLTGNGVSDDHSGRPWQSLGNGHLTGIWAASSSERDLAAALAGGRAFAFHPGRTRGLQLDTLVDDLVPMGKASVSSATSRRIAIQVAQLPADCTVELLIGPVDYTGQDPGTSLVRSWGAAAFGAGGTGTVTADINTTASCFVRTQIRRSGALTATGNPTWLLRQPPPGGIPTARAA